MLWALGKGMVRADFLEGALIMQEILQGKKIKCEGRRRGTGEEWGAWWEEERGKSSAR